MEQVFLTVEQLAERWQCSASEIRTRKAEGKIQASPNVPGIKFRVDYINELDGVKLDKMSPLERRRLERELDEMKKLNASLKSILAKYQMVGSEALGILTASI